MFTKKFNNIDNKVNFLSETYMIILNKIKCHAFYLYFAYKLNIYYMMYIHKRMSKRFAPLFLGSLYTSHTQEYYNNNNSTQQFI